QGRQADLVISPGGRAALEVYGRWPAGTRFNKDAKTDARPALGVILVALKGELQLHGAMRLVTLRAPPGPAILLGDNLNEIDPVPQHLDELPAWAKAPGQTARAKMIRENIGKFRKAVMTKGVQGAIEDMAKSDDSNVQRLGIYLMAALDNLKGVGAVMAACSHCESFDNCVFALRHWLGRAPGQDRDLYRRLTDIVKMPPGEAEIVVNLLHGFSKDDLTQPETYETLIDYLESDLLPIRGLAYWHLQRLAPDGKDFGYDPTGEKADRVKAI